MNQNKFIVQRMPCFTIPKIENDLDKWYNI